MVMYGLPLDTIFTGIDDRLLTMINNLPKPTEFCVSLQYLVERSPGHLTYTRENIRYNVDHFLLQSYTEELTSIAKRIANLPKMIDANVSVNLFSTPKHGQIFIVGSEEYIATQRQQL